MSGHGVPWLLLAAALLAVGHTALGYRLLVALLADLAVAAGMKAIFRRKRPAYNASKEMKQR